MNPKAEEFVRTNVWGKELTLLRNILLECMLEEDIKWGKPCYSYRKTNIIILQDFKSYCAIGFFKGSLLSDPKNLLSKPGENSQSMRQLRFTSPDLIPSLEADIKAFIFEAIQIEEMGMKVELKQVDDYEIPLELNEKFNQDSHLKSAFEALTPGRKRAYLIHFTEAKQSETRTARIEKMIPRIMIGLGLNDCICGLTKRKPGCDGSHRQLKDNK